MSYKPFNPFVPPPRMAPRVEMPVDKKGRPIDPKKFERQKITRFLVNPDLGSGLQDIKHTHGMFLRLVCNIFLQVGLVDAAYPGISDDKYLTLRSLLTYAYRNLEYTREGMPRVLMFYSFVSSIVAMGFAIMVFAITLTSNGGGHRHAVQHVGPNTVQQAAPQAAPQTAPQPVQH